MIVAINSSGGGSDSGLTGNGIVEKNYTLDLSRRIANNLEKYGIKTYLLRNDDATTSYENRLKKLAEYAGNEKVLLLSNTLNNSNGTDIIYALRNNDKLAVSLSKALEYFNTTKYYQLRYPSNTKLDYYYITRETPNYETIIVRYGNPAKSSDAKALGNINEIAEAVSNAIIEYLGVEKVEESQNTYIVKSGDTLYSIAKKFNTTVDKLKEMNNLTSNLIKLNQALNIPSKTITIKAGDTLYSIAKNNNTTVQKIMDLNNLKNSIIHVGDVLYLP